MATQQRKRISKTTSTGRKRATEKKSTAKSKAVRTPMRREIKIFISSFVTLVLFLSYYTPLFGAVGNFVRKVGLAFFGYPAYALPVFIGIFILHKSIKGSVKPYRVTYIYALGVMLLLSFMATINASTGDTEYLVTTSVFDSVVQCINNGITTTDGGLLGALGIPLMALCSPFGARLLIVFGIVFLVAAITKFIPIIWVINLIRDNIVLLQEKFREVSSEIEEDEAEYEEGNDIKPKKVREVKVKEKNKQMELDFEKAKEDEEKNPDSKKSFALPTVKSKPLEEKKADKDPLENASINIFLPSENTEEEEKQAEVNLPKPSENIKEDLTVTVEPSAPVLKSEPNTAIGLSEDEFIEPVKPYVFPPINLLEKNTERAPSGKGGDLREQARVLIETLKSFGVEAKILEVNKGPTVTRFELQPATGVKVSKIVNLADDIALNLAALSVRIEAPIPGKAAVGIEIPNAGGALVRLREVIDSEEFKSFNAKTAFALGKNITGTPIVTDIAKMPHVLIAGATGSGKSVCINSLITSIIYKADPREVKFIMIDPKVVELKVYNGIPHLLIPVVTDPRKAAGALNWAVQEMTKRYKMFADNNVRDIKGYNELALLQGEKQLEQIIIIVDELADLMMVAPRDVEDAICRLAQMARAAGMHLVVATQRPSVDVITGVIKANIPSRIAFAVSSQIDSRTILDMGGAEKLLGKGDMLFLPMGASKPTRIQGAFITDKEVEKVVDFVKQEDVKYDEDVMEKIENGVSGEKAPDGGDADELLPSAIEIVVEAGQASASLLQRRLKVGYSRAGRLIDQLEERGIIGPHEGAKPRSVLISRAEYAEMTMQSE
ncbi:MAG: DNA translocase FtsK [Clostridia bacterium]